MRDMRLLKRLAAWIRDQRREKPSSAWDTAYSVGWMNAIEMVLAKIERLETKSECYEAVKALFFKYSDRASTEEDSKV